jgi:iron complex outermembrane recepter protein
MSELINTKNSQCNFRWRLLASVSMATLVTAGFGASSVAAGEDANRPTVWIELGGQLERTDASSEVFSPPFMDSITQPNLLSALDVQKPSKYSVGAEGKLSFQPEGSDWVFSASLRYGRSNGSKAQHQQTPNAKIPFYIPSFKSKYGLKYPSSHVRFADGKSSHREQHLTLDFMAGKDVGLGMFGNGGTSIFSAGVRVAQLNSRGNVNLHAEPDVQYPTAAITSVAGFLAFRSSHLHFHDYAAMAVDQRSFHGLGPSIAWNASAPFMGNRDHAELTFDWEGNAALLFGRQKASGQHQTTAKTYNRSMWIARNADGNVHPGYFSGGTQNPGGAVGPAAQHTNSVTFNRARSVVVPNIGGAIGVSLKWPNAKVSLGYRADFFFGAMDGGLDTAKSENRGFYGPFATISVGLGG